MPWYALDSALKGRWQYFACMAGWALFTIYWDIAKKNAAPTKSSESRGSRRVHVILINLALLLELIPMRALGRLLPATPNIMAAGLALEGVGLALAIWARVHLGRNWSSTITIKVEHQLIRTGPYRLLRHPIYTGVLAMGIGTLLVTGERLALIGMAAAAYAYWRKIRLEEAVLNTAFGPDYAAYRRATWALVPGIY